MISAFRYRLLIKKFKFLYWKFSAFQTEILNRLCSNNSTDYYNVANVVLDDFVA